MSILITGSNGLLGQKIVAQLLKAKIPFVATSKGENRNPDCPQKYYQQLDITKPSEIEAKSLVMNPDIMEFMDLIKVSGKAAVNLEEITFNELPDEVKFTTIADLETKSMSGCNVIGYRSEDGEYIINPPAETEILPNSKLFVLGNPEQIKKLNTIFGLK